MTDQYRCRACGATYEDEPAECIECIRGGSVTTVSLLG